MKAFLNNIFQVSDTSLRTLEENSSWVIDPKLLPSKPSPTGQAFAFATFMGWSDVESHGAATKTDELKRTSRPVMATVFGWVHLIHFVFRG